MSNADPSQRALQRITASRERLRGALLPAPLAQPTASSAQPHRWPRLLWRWLARTPLAPALKPAWRAAAAWWLAHPWRPAAELVGGTVVSELRPAVRKHPVLAVGLGAALGAALVATRPWTWARPSAPMHAALRMALAGFFAAVGPVRQTSAPMDDTQGAAAGPQ